ncbi:hypothetical protein [Burkholderia pseudomallei]|uniref:hypothetical protein n=1 Tax=Burkholderia pseudomallei TaxID=28450 RepID=UPI000530D675|nr:hypothetical protein [Burkholderia pseudomallei]KGX76401.1 hypothetical protein Y033_2081 [Burkholderia pseudomallei MSHR435]AJX22374.1 hypothetical protein BG17_699 [Burkholderia pseudomallei MSHR491]AJX78597.1 hypothetical protein BG16_2028 [Burkholderia pseudomallei MSHR2543]KGS74465.1 hypothetical protein X942_5463 [Burkholderia pseudomallei MSHR5596]KGW87598.1 hypothetical protein Y048_3286 [Burkholderia pseudomallei MSHR456]
MHIADLITGHDGKLSHSKLWPNVAAAVATGMFIYQGITKQLTIETWAIYLGCVGGYSAVIQALAAWRGRPSKERANDDSNL